MRSKSDERLKKSGGHGKIFYWCRVIGKLNNSIPQLWYLYVRKKSTRSDWCLKWEKIYIAVNNALHCAIVGRICKIPLLLLRFVCDCSLSSLFQIFDYLAPWVCSEIWLLCCIPLSCLLYLGIHSCVSWGMVSLSSMSTSVSLMGFYLGCEYALWLCLAS